jgi:hypothetical protein
LPAPAEAEPDSASPAETTVTAPPVTITGCLEVSVDEDQYRLTDTEGANAPVARSWRSGFLKKRPTPIALVEPPSVLALRSHVGQRIAATGILTNRELHPSALRVVNRSCDE